MGILNAGVQIVTLQQPVREYTSDSINDIAGILEPIISMVRAYEESDVKSQRGKAKWQARRDGIANGKKIVHSSKVLPAWVEPNADRTDFVIIPEVAATVRQIFQMSLAGYGVRTIAARLIEADIKPIGKTSTWHESYIRLIIKNRAALGEYQSYRSINGERVKIGEPVPNYFPAVIDADTFDRVQAGQTARFPKAKAGTGRKGRSQENPGEAVRARRTFFKGLIMRPDGRAPTTSVAIRLVIPIITSSIAARCVKRRVLYFAHSLIGFSRRCSCLRRRNSRRKI